jgi:RHS repeat-associated protein
VFLGQINKQYHSCHTKSSLQWNYNSFGSIMPGREYTAQSVAGYRFGFNTQERDDEVYGKGNASSAQFWEYDTRLGRRWNKDPITKVSESPYSCFSNNPICLVDSKGLDTSFANNKTGEQFNETYKKIENELNKLTEKIEKNLESWNKQGYDNTKVNNKMIKQLTFLNEKRSKLVELKSSFDAVINSPITFHFSALPNPNNVHKNGGGTIYDIKNNRVNIEFFSNNSWSLVHETRHGAGYVWFEWGNDRLRDISTNYDYQDEYEGIKHASYYLSIFYGELSRSKKDIQSDVKASYTSENIIKDSNFRQNCVPNLQLK